MRRGAEHGAQLAARVLDHLEPGESFRAAVWVSRADARPPDRLTRAEMSPFRFRRSALDRPGARRVAQGSPRSVAAGLDEHVRLVTEPRVLALTDRRLLILSVGSRLWHGLLRPSSNPLRPRWDCPRDSLASSTERAGRLRLAFTDGSAVTLLTPAAHLQAFLEG